MNTTRKRQRSDTMAAIRDIFEEGIQFSLNLIDSLSASSMSMLDQAMSSSTVREFKPRFSTITAPGASSTCEIPPPCWAPQPIGEVVCHVCPGGTATLRLRVTNCGPRARNIKVETGSDRLGVKIDPPDLQLAPMERGFVTVSVSIPAEAGSGQEYDFLLWVRGCRNHYLRWIVKAASRGASCCHEVEIEDCPDLVHHWYDHFYCDRPCVN